MRTILLLVVSFPLLGQMFPFPGPGLSLSTPIACGGTTPTAASGVVNGTTLTVNLSVSSGDVIVALTGGPLATANSVTADSGALTFTQQSTTHSDTGDGVGFVNMWTATATTTESMAVVATPASSTSYGLTVIDIGKNCSVDTSAIVGGGTAAAATITSSTFSPTASSGTGVILFGVSSYYWSTSWVAGLIGGSTSTIALGASQGAGTGGVNTAIEYRLNAGSPSSITAAITAASGNLAGGYIVLPFK